MSYTIATIDDVQGNISVNFDSVGNKYLVGLYNNETKEYTHMEYERQQEAYNVFERLSRAVVFGLYSYEQRKELVKGGCAD